MKEEFWIPIHFGSTETMDSIIDAISACYDVHAFSVETLNDYFIDHAETYPYTSFRVELGLFIKEGQLTSHAQRYSLIKAAEQSFPYWNENKKFDKKIKFTSVKPIPPDQYHSIQIEAREVWSKFLALNNLITTRYGTVYLAEEWKSIVADQAEKKGVPFYTIPFLTHSATLYVTEREASIHFNLHDLKSKFGKKAKREIKIQEER